MMVTHRTAEKSRKESRDRNCFRQLSLVIPSPDSCGWVPSAIHEKSYHSDRYCSHRVFCNSSCDDEDRKKSSPAGICEWESRNGRGYFREKSRGSVVLGK